ncbi:MAG: hypothetical protein O3C57_08005 [Verrucomicrobia bacterium]|nr:hypothetical protein [Verrucomicrobiota bacterium]
MPKQTSFIAREPDGIKREVRVTITRRELRWQHKREDEERWHYDEDPRAEDWVALEDILERRSGRGRHSDALALVRRLKPQTGS